MSDLKISQLEELFNPYSSDVVPIVHEGITKKTPINSIVRHLSATLEGQGLIFTGTNYQNVSGHWESTYTTVLANSAQWAIDRDDVAVNTLVRSNSAAWNLTGAYQGTDIKALTGNWQKTYTNVNSNSADWSRAFTNLVANSAAYLSSVDLSFLSISANWNSVYSTVLANSAANWNYQGTDLKSLSANWQSTYTTVQNNSAVWLEGGSASDFGVRSLSGNWESTYTTFKNASSTFLTSETDSQTLSFDEGTKDLSISSGNTISLSSLVDTTAIDTGVRILTSAWSSTYNTVQSNSAIWLEGGSASDFGVRSLTASYDSTYSTVQSNSATTWNYQGTDLKGLSGNWQDTFTIMQAKSAIWDEAVTSGYTGTDIKALTGNWESTYNTFNSVSSTFLTTETDSQTLSFDEGTKNLSISNGNTVSLSSLIDGTAVDTGLRSLTGDYASVYSTVLANSSTNWNYQGTDLKDLSADWQNTYTNFSSQSSNNDSVYSLVQSNSANWDASFATAGADVAVRALTGSWDSVYSTVLANSSTNWNYQGTDLKDLSANWQNAFTTVSTNSAKWESVYSNVNSNSATYATASFADSKYFAISGGTITGPTQFNNNITIYGNISATGASYFSNTFYSTTSALSVVNIGNNGPALFVGNNGTGDIASFYDLDDNIEVLHVGGNNGSFPNVGVKTSEPNKTLTVNGEISASGDIWTSGRILSGGQELLSIVTPNINSVFSTVQSNSATTWNYQGTDLKGLSGNWQDTFTIMQAKSAIWDEAATSGYTGTDIKALTGNWQNTYNTVFANSATNWNYQGTDLKNLSAGWVGGNAAFTNLVANSAAYLSSVDLSFLSVSANWNSVYNAVQSASANYILDGGNTKGSNLLIGTNDNFNLALETNGLPRLTILNDGNIGINETSPEGKLHVTAGSAGTVVAQPSSVGVFESSGNAYLSLLSPTSRFAGVVMGGPTNSYGSYVSWNHDNLALKVATNHTGASIQMLAGTEQEAMRITSGGNVGIGTISPLEKLTVSGNISASGNLYGNASLLTNVIDSGVRALTGNYNSVFSTVQSNSATAWNYQGTDIKALTGNWQNTFTTVSSFSATWGGTPIDSGVRALTGNWQSTYTNFSTQSANNASVYSTFQSNSATWRLEDFIVACSDESTNLTTTTSAVTFRVPFAMYLNSIRASVNVAPVGSTIIVDIRQTGTSIFSTKLSIDANEETSATAATPAVISNPNLTDDAKIVVSIDQVGSSTAGKGLKLTFKGYRV